MKIFKVRVYQEITNRFKTYMVSSTTPEDAQQLAFALDGGWGSDPHAEEMLPLAQSYAEVIEKNRKK
jgi:hypothetical protein